MRVITGIARGRVLKTLEGESVRPTSERVKEAVFSILQFEIEGRRVLDLFAGSGQLGIETLSRGAASAVFIESDKAAVAVVKANLESTGLAEKATVVQTDAFAFLQTSGLTFDIIFLDPPFAAGLVQRALPLAAAITAPGGIILCEAPFAEKLPEEAGALKQNRVYKYGKTAITTYR
ncbi:MAG: 16S rRNA (guanine(966)-N(2))-methyltransferase RsmD [Clostridiales bacterium]|nr:16S rRNA (guanine(966)-N(2))-methyltransferase RsmD [Clostridiales bacterium]